jgi:hypothetical protein
MHNPSTPFGVATLFLAGYTGVDHSRILNFSVQDGLLVLEVDPHWNDELDTCNTDFFITSRKYDDGVSLSFEFPENGSNFLGKSDSPFGDGKALYESELDRCAMEDKDEEEYIRELLTMRPLWEAERANEHSEREQENFIR